MPGLVPLSLAIFFVAVDIFTSILGCNIFLSLVMSLASDDVTVAQHFFVVCNKSWYVFAVSKFGEGGVGCFCSRSRWYPWIIMINFKYLYI